MWNTLPKWSILSQEVLGSGLRLPNSAGYGGVALYHHTLRRYDLLLSDLAFLGVLLRAWGTLCASTPNRTSDSPSLDGRTQPRGHRAPDLQTSGTGGPGRSGGLRFDDLLQELSEVPNLDPRGMEPNPVQLPPAHPQQGQLRHMPPPHMANMPGGGANMVAQQMQMKQVQQTQLVRSWQHFLAKALHGASICLWRGANC